MNFHEFIDLIIKNEHLVTWSGIFFDFLLSHQLVVYGFATFMLIIASSLESTHRMILNGRLNKHLASLAKERPRTLNEGKEKKILVVGDSTAYGTGADRVEDSLTGRFAHDFPDVEVNNYAVNGSITGDVITQLTQAEKQHYNLLLISTGGNDTWKLTKKKDIENNLRIVLTKAKEIAGDNVVVLVYNNIASGPVFPFLLRPLILARSRMISEIFTRIPQEFGIESVPIFLDGEGFSANFFARDGLHPSSEGYRIMYIRLWSVLYRRMYDFKLREY